MNPTYSWAPLGRSTNAAGNCINSIKYLNFKYLQCVNVYIYIYILHIHNTQQTPNLFSLVSKVHCFGWLYSLVLFSLSTSFLAQEIVSTCERWRTDSFRVSWKHWISTLITMWPSCDLFLKIYHDWSTCWLCQAQQDMTGLFGLLWRIKWQSTDSSCLDIHLVRIG